MDSTLPAAFAIGGVGDPTTYDWHSHGHHQLLYAFEGTLSVEAAGKTHLLPQRRAALIPEGLLHRTVRGFAAGARSQGRRSRIASVYLRRRLAPVTATNVVVFPAPPLLVEMFSRAVEWGPEHTPTSLSNSFFRTIGLFCAEWTSAPVEFWLPGTNDSRMREVMRWAEKNSGDADEVQAAAAANVSPRTFRRQFEKATGLTWREYITRARLLHAAQQLAATDENVAEIAWSSGYRSAPAFAKAFHKFTGQTPGEYRRG